KLKKLLHERLAVLRDMADLARQAHAQGAASYEQVHRAERAVLDAELDVCETDKERIVVLEKIVAAARDFENHVIKASQGGTVPPSAVAKARVARLEGEIALERARLKAGEPTKKK